MLILRPVMFSVMTLSLGTYVVKPFFPTCAEPPVIPVKIFTVIAMCEYILSSCADTDDNCLTYVFLPPMLFAVRMY